MTLNQETIKNLEAVKSVREFRDAKENTIRMLAKSSQKVTLEQGETLLTADKIATHCFLLIEGTLRLLSVEPNQKDLFTVGRVESGQVVGIIDLLRQSSCEVAIARQAAKLLSFPLELIVDLYKSDDGFRNGLNKMESPCEAAAILKLRLNQLNPPPADEVEWIKNQIKNNEDIKDKECEYLLSTEILGDEKLLGCKITNEEKERLEKKSKLPVRYWKYYRKRKTKESHKKMENVRNDNETDNKNEDILTWNNGEEINLVSLGIREASSKTDLQGFKLIKGRGLKAANVATLRMLARAYDTPCPIDVIEKIIEASLERSGSVPFQGMGQLAESLGLQTQIGAIDLELIHKLEFPVMIKYENYYALMTGVEDGRIIIANPEKGWQRIKFAEARKIWGDEIGVVLLKRLADTPTRKFGWSWFTPVIKRFRWPLIQVLLASLFIQLFQLANPLLIQQIIDKVINQSNLSALQVLGAALVVAALFQGLLTAVRTWLLIDTTDRMDLVLGTQVIDKLLRLPLRFFEKRPVGELSQRLSELGNLRNFLTGTAITSALDILFAIIYIFIMLFYSPLLTAVALGTIPLYILLVVFIAPVYRNLIRKQAMYSARTQSHLIETLGGIQTVKAQHFELNSRWKWQERYSGQIAEGFKGVVLGSSAGEIGNFLNQLSTLLIIWVGVYQVVNGQLSLGQLIAFRIIAGYVTGPILRLSSLWEGFQQVGISMERLADIVDQVPEAGESEADQISLPPIKGKVKFDSITFRFGKTGPNQIESVNLEIKPGSFIGIVGQSGSGKSTLMKLLPRLYEPNQGKILIDNYDISKVSMSSVRQQIGIVPQDCLLFEGTVRENISMNFPEASTENIIRVAKAAAAHDFIMELAEGYGTRIGERGAGLSGGQKQRIAIARTLLANPNLLVLDEATSALDYDTESTVCINLQNELKGKTVFFITHRLSTVRHADNIILMHQGRIDEQGTHEELIEKGGRYAALYSHQGDI